MFSKLTIYDFLTQFIPGALIYLIIPIPYIHNDYNYVLAFVIALTIGMTYHRLVEFISNRVGYPKHLDIRLQSHAKRKRDTDREHDYYKAYYAIFKSKSVDSVFILEAHYCFIKNLLPILFVYMILNWCDFLCIEIGDAQELYSVLCYYLPVIVIALSLTNIYIRYKIYELVFQAEHFLKYEKDCSTDNTSK